MAMLHTVYDITPARLNAIMPTLQQMEDDPAFLERRRRRFDVDDDNDPPPPYSSGTTTQLASPNPYPPVADNVDIDELLRKPLSNEEIFLLRYKVGNYRPHCQYDDDFIRANEMIDREYCRRDENYNWLYRGPNLLGRAGDQRQQIMARHSIKKQWERMGIWNPEWGIPHRVHIGPRDKRGDWSWKWDSEQTFRDRESQYDSLPDEAKIARWPSRDEEEPDERAVRRYLIEKGEWNEALDPQPLESDRSSDVHIDDRESFITSRPWYRWNLEVEEEEIRIKRHPDTWDLWHRQRNNVTARWKEKGDWKESWGDVPGWKWRHESPSPEPADPNDMEFTPSEIDALEEIPPPTPRPVFEPGPAEEYRGLGWEIFSHLGKKPDVPPSPSTEPTAKPQVDGDGDHEGDGPPATAEPGGEERPQGSFETQVCTTSGAEHGEPSSSRRRPRRGKARGEPEQGCERPPRPTAQRRLSSSNRPSRPTAKVEKPLPGARMTQPSKTAPRTLTQSSRISKPTPRRSARIAARAPPSKGTGNPSETANAGGQEDPAPPPSKERRQQKRKASTRATTRREDSAKATDPPASSKPQGVTKRKGRSRSKKSNR